MATRIGAPRMYVNKTEYDVYILDKRIVATVTSCPATVTAWITDVTSHHSYDLRVLFVGFGVQTRPDFDPETVHPIGILQLCVGRRCLIIQIYQMARHNALPPRSLLNFFHDQENIFVGVGTGANLQKLKTDYGFGDEVMYENLGTVAAEVYKRPELEHAGLRELANVVLGKDVHKPLLATMSSDWDAVDLTDMQVLYACIDAFVSTEIWLGL